MPPMKHLPTRPPLSALWGRRTVHRYDADQGLLAATNAAIALGQPLLLTGEPGCGKTDFAFAVARFQSGKGQAWQPDDLEDGLLDCYVRSDSRARDLLYHYDAVRRFGEAQHGDRRLVADARHFIELRPLGRALADAERGRRRVVLIDEIDKAPRDLPNDLLRELDQGCFEIKECPVVPPADAPAEVADRGLPIRALVGLRRPEAHTRPLVIVTSNEERQLPDAFLRRCIFHHIRFPSVDRLTALLADIRAATPESPPAAGPDQDRAAARTFAALRNVDGLRKPPATAELLAWYQLGLQGVIPGDFLNQIMAFARIISDDKEGRPAKASRKAPLWRDLPGLGCLIKQRADWDMVGPT